MHPKSPKWLQDIADACALIRRATQGQTLAAYEQDAVNRSAVERNFEIIGRRRARIARLHGPRPDHIAPAQTPLAACAKRFTRQTAKEDGTPIPEPKGRLVVA